MMPNTSTTGSITAKGTRVPVIADGLCLAAVWLMTLDLSTLLAQFLEVTLTMLAETLAA